jgi:glycine cleavage system T protein
MDLKGAKSDDRIIDESVLEYIFSEDLRDTDCDVQRIIDLEDERQTRKIILIASESMCPAPVRHALASNFVNIYAEGYPSYRLIREITDTSIDYAHHLSYLRRYSDRRYYKGVEYVDFIEALAEKRIALSFATPEVPASEIFVNVQPLSGAAANNAVYEAFLKPGDVVMGMDLTHGGHLTHGSKANRSGKNYTVVSYHANYATGEIDYAEMEKLARENRPKMIIAGYSAYPRLIDWKRFREIADSVGAILMADISHPAGLVVAGCFPSPINHVDVTTFTTHKTLCGPRGACIITTDEEKAKKIDNAVFPGEQGGPHINTIAAKAVLFKLVRTERFRELQRQVLQNSRDMAAHFKSLGMKLAYGGTDSHMCLIDILGIKGTDGYPLKGEIASRILDLCGITCNKNTIPGDTNAAHPGALRFGATWITQRGFKKKETERLAEIIHSALTAMKPFRYVEAQGDVGRAKVPLETLDKTQQEVKELLLSVKTDSSVFKAGYPYYLTAHDDEQVCRSPLLPLHEEAKAKVEAINGHMLPLYYKSSSEYDSWKTGTWLVDLSDQGLVEIYGERSSLFLEEIAAGDVLSVEPGHSIHTLLLDDDAKVLDDVLIARLPAIEGRQHRYIVRTHPARTNHLIELLRALSDGYVLFDRSDLYSKIQGPAVIEDLRSCADAGKRLITIGLYGPNASAVLKKTGLSPAFSEEADYAAGSLDGTTLHMIRIVMKGQHLGYELMVNPEKAGALWSALLEKGKDLGLAQGGVLLREKMRAEMGLPEHRRDEEPVDSLKLYQGGFECCFKLGKPYFAGQRALLSKLKPDAKRTSFEFTEVEGEPLQTCLFEEHRKLTKKLVPFAGYTMPVWYTGINEEHKAVRERAGLFDVSHMGVLEFKGRDAARFLDVVSTNYVTKLKDGQSQYSYLLDPKGDVLDDIMVYRRADDLFMVIVNAANANKIKAWIPGVISGKHPLDDDFLCREWSGDVQFRDLKDPACGKDQRVDLAIQGPASRPILMKLMKDDGDRKKLRCLKRSEFFESTVAGIDAIISRTGYTGEELGYELYLHPDNAVAMWKILLETGAPLGLIPTGLGARDSTRTEAGLPLYGHELAGPHNITPHEAGYGSFVKFHKTFFIGRKAIIEKEAKRDMEIVRFRMLGKGLKTVKTGDPLVTKKGDFIGTVTSCVHIEGTQIGLALVKRRYAQPNTRVAIFILPRDAKSLSEKSKAELGSGDKVLLHEEAMIITRFPVQGCSKEEQLDRE